MSLQVWLPLTKDLRNQGLASLTTSGTPVFKNNGKLGSKSLDLKTQISFNCSAMANKTIFSIAFWAKVNADSSLTGNWVDVIGFTDVSTSGTNGQLRWETCYGSTSYRGSTYNQAWNISSHDNATYATAQMSSNPIQEDKGKWHHYVFTTSGVQAIEYRDGIVYANYTGNGGHLNGSFWCGQTNAINGEIQDVRIYDHCLSPMEVKELAKGLVLHYPLNRGGWGQENFILESHKVTSGGNGSGITRTYESDGSMKIVSTSGNGNYASLGFAQNSNTSIGNNMVVGDTYCISCDTKIESGSTLPTLFINSGNGYKQLKPVNGSIVTDKWMRVYYTSTWAEPGTQYGNISLHLGFSSAIGTYYFKNFKLEKGSIPTPWCPNTADTNNMNINGTTEYDCSGYCNNANSNGSVSLTYSSDTPKYNVSTVFASGARIATLVSASTFMPTDAITVSIWFKSSAAANRFISCTEGGGFNFESASGKISFPIYITGKGYTRVDGNTTWSEVSDNKWHMITATYDKQNTILYIDGQLDKSTASSYPNIDIGYSTITPFTLGAEAQTITSPIAGTYVGNLSDCRIYATALSADDVKSLYQNCATIDADGTIRGQIRS